MSEREYAGGCACGAVRYAALGPAANLCFCHCASCRRAAGATPVAWGTFAATRFRVTRGALAFHRSSPPVQRGFCAQCGGALTYAHSARPNELDVTLASLDEPSALAPEAHIWLADRAVWAPVSDGLPKYERWRPEG